MSARFFQRLLSKVLLTRVVYEIEQRRTRPIRDRVFTFPPLIVAEVDHAPPLIILTSPHFLKDACWAAYSQLSALRKKLALHFILDGEIATDEEGKLKTLFPGIKVSSSQSYVASLPKSCPTLRWFAENHPMGRKLVLFLVIQQCRSFLYSDSDVLCVGSMPEVEAVLQNNDSNYYLDNEDSDVNERRLIEIASDMGLHPAKCLNAGFMFVRKGSLSIDLAEKLLNAYRANGHLDLGSWFIEQTIVAILMGSCGATPFPRERYVLNLAGQFYWQRDVDLKSVALRHFVGPVRHRMYSKAMPFISNKILGRAGARERILR